MGCSQTSASSSATASSSGEAATRRLTRLLRARPSRRRRRSRPRGCAGAGGRPGAATSLLDELAVGPDGGRLEQPDELGERLVLAVVRGGAGQDQRVGVAGRAPGRAGCSACAELVTLCDSSMTTASQRCLRRCGEVAVLLERVDRDDRPLEVGERVAGGRAASAGPAGCRPSRGGRTAGRSGSTSRAASARARGAGVTMRIRSPRPRRTSSARIMPISSVLPRPTASASRMRGRRLSGSSALSHGRLLVGERVGEGLGGDREARVVERDRGLAERRLEPQSGCAGTRASRRRRPSSAPGRATVIVVERLVEGGRGVADQLARALDGRDSRPSAVARPP